MSAGFATEPVGIFSEQAFRAQFERFCSGAANGRGFAIGWSDRLPCLEDRRSSTGFDRHYVYHTAWDDAQLARLRSCQRWSRVTHWPWAGGTPRSKLNRSVQTVKNVCRRVMCRAFHPR